MLGSPASLSLNTVDFFYSGHLTHSRRILTYAQYATKGDVLDKGDGTGGTIAADM